jgi:hypothetical protein
MDPLVIPVLQAILKPVLSTGQKLVATAAEFAIEQRKLRFERYQFDEAMRHQDREFAEQVSLRREFFYAQKQMQWDLAQLHYRELHALAREERKTLLASEEYKKILDAYPWNVFPTPLLESFNAQGVSGALPLLVILAPPEIDAEISQGTLRSVLPIEKTIAQELRRFFEFYTHEKRPVHFLGGIWSSKQFHSESAATTLFWLFKSIPTLILESEIDGDHLTFRTTYWDLNYKRPAQQTILSRLPYRKLLYEIAKTDARRWRTARNRYIALGKTPAEIAAIGGEDETNLLLLEEEERDRSVGIDWDRGGYAINRRHIDRFGTALGACHSLVAGLIVDAYSLVNHRLPPILPLLLPSFETPLLVHGITPFIAAAYSDLYRSLESYLPDWTPELRLELAGGLAHLGETSLVREQIDLALRAWLPAEYRGARLELDQAVSILLQASVPDDQPLLERFCSLLLSLGNSPAATRLDKLLETWRSKRLSGSLIHDAQGDTLYDTWG